MIGDELSGTSAGKHSISVKKVNAFDPGQKNAHLNNADKIGVYCPPSILSAFQQLMAQTQLPGTSFVNPYTGLTEIFPNSPAQFTARHLQILARNEAVNGNGEMKVELYGEYLTAEQVATLRCLVKSTVVSGLTQVSKSGGYPPGNPIVEKIPPQKMLIIDQSGLQWQGDLHNTGGMFFYPEQPLDSQYTAWQNAMYKTMYGQDRPATSSENFADVIWQGKKGKLDLNQVAMAIECEFMQALDAAASQGEVELAHNEKINFRYLKAGMGFFADGLTLNGAPGKDNPALCLARLNGIDNVLRRLAVMAPADRQNALRKIGRLELPFSDQPLTPEIQQKLQSIKQLCGKIGLEWGGAGKIDVLADNPSGYVTAATNTADPHAMIGNEGHYGSVDAAVVMNAGVNHLNAGYNTSMVPRPLLEVRTFLELSTGPPVPPHGEPLAQPQLLQPQPQPEPRPVVSPPVADLLFEANPPPRMTPLPTPLAGLMAAHAVEHPLPADPTFDALLQPQPVFRPSEAARHKSQLNSVSEKILSECRDKPNYCGIIGINEVQDALVLKMAPTQQNPTQDNLVSLKENVDKGISYYVSNHDDETIRNVCKLAVETTEFGSDFQVPSDADPKVKQYLEAAIKELNRSDPTKAQSFSVNNTKVVQATTSIPVSRRMGG